MQHILGQVRRCVEDYHMIEAGDKVAVGVSGGKDSLLTLTALARLRDFYPIPFQVEAITLETGTPGMSFDAVAELCRELEVPYTRIHVPVYQIVFEERKEKNPCSLCAKLRRGSLNTALTERGIHKIALGHHYDDAIETLLMNLLFEGAHRLLPAGDVSGPHGHHPDPSSAVLPGGRHPPHGGTAPPAGGPQPLSCQRLHPSAGGEGSDPPAGGALSRHQAEAFRQSPALSSLRLESGAAGALTDGFRFYLAGNM